MNSLKERIEESNKETIIIDKKLMELKMHLTINKILCSKRTNDEKPNFGFFKVFNGNLELHICICRNDIKEWYRFSVIDADPEDVIKNKKLNVLDRSQKK